MSLAAHDLRFYRTRHKLTGEQFGKIIGVVRSTVSRYELGELKINEDQAMALDHKFYTGGHFRRLLPHADPASHGGHEMTKPVWRKSSRSNAQGGDCVEAFAQLVERIKGSGFDR